MKFSTVLIFTLALVFSSNSNATLLTDVGGVDTFIASTSIKSGDKFELSWVHKILNDNTITLDDKYNSSSSDWSFVEDNIYSTQLINNPTYFLLKFGNGNTNGGDSHYLFENVGDLSFAVINFSGIGLFSVTNLNIGKISHVDEFDANPSQSQSNPIPEPMTISLFSLALLGLARRK